MSAGELYLWRERNEVETHSFPEHNPKGTRIVNKATIATVNIGSNLSIVGLRLTDKRFAIAVPQVAAIYQFDTNQASRKLKPLLGKDFQFDTCTSELNPKAVNIVFLSQFETINFELMLQGNH